ncbi:hypothetical protein LGN43_00030 [Burkholderia multivorans]|nr:hypothetical protein [Burkholderia multivorans]
MMRRMKRRDTSLSRAREGRGASWRASACRMSERHDAAAGFFARQHVQPIAGNNPRGLLLGIDNMSLRKLKKSRARRAKLPRKTRSGN